MSSTSSSSSQRPTHSTSMPHHAMPSNTSPCDLAITFQPPHPSSSPSAIHDAFKAYLCCRTQSFCTCEIRIRLVRFVSDIHRHHLFLRQACRRLASNARAVSCIALLQGQSDVTTTVLQRYPVAKTVKVPQMAVSISLRSWSKQVGDTVEADGEVTSIETDKIDVTVDAPVSGTIVELLAKEEETVTVGQDLFRIEAGTSRCHLPVNPKRTSHRRTRPGGSSKGRPMERATTPPPASPQKRSGGPQGNQPEPAALPKAPDSRNETRVKMNRMCLRIAEHLKESQNAAASLTIFNEIDMSSLMDMRKKFKDEILKDMTSNSDS
ncbi:hypothetical protein JVT61DRAFT_8700 [Boletus reticuloceps]|uniref:Dihydrolipoamide acetyltransferase component of pyruvate dehydrogenase complex n=1 Tax=Boletus reticuloceps TaxID=495285 RepID=A0A8I2YZI0_9AGAM|nr:hypothetical protein JVT61DRAFT_12284 [Boletus reticuloceps]KAG6380532.1 hypothetical protein JVT61DRAFT_8700 [Boletus reticuloceps]